MRTTQGIISVFLASFFSLCTVSLFMASPVSFALDELQDDVKSDIEQYPETPQETIELVTTELLSELQGLRSMYDESAENFYAGIETIVAPWIDFDAFYKGVMGRKYYTAASQDQRDRFKEAFHQSLIETYGKGLLAVEETRFEVAPSVAPKKPGGSVYVEQILFSDSGRIAVVYTMGQQEDGRWKLKNVVLEGINLGKTFRNQFARAAREHSGDLDLVIDGWSSDS